MKRLFVCILIIFNILILSVSPKPATASEKYESVSPKTATASEKYESVSPKTATASEMYESVSASSVAHFFTHSLIAYAEIAFEKNNEMRKAYDADCVTISEFKAFLTALYNRNYVLIDLADTYTQSGKPAQKKVIVPKGKKPLVLSFDDLNYYRKKMHLGMCDKLIVKDGRLATFTVNASPQINFDNEHITILENFIKAHPDFSYNKARGVICLTGFDGILGYRTESGSTNRASEIKRVTPIIELLKRKGWRFACHGYGHYHMKKISEQRFKRDTEKWLDEVGTLVGKTDIYCYPYGEWEVGDENGLSTKQKTLTEGGFRLFLGVGEKNFYGKLPYSAKAKESILLMDRKPFDGISLRGLAKEYAEYMDCSKIYDTKQRFLPFKNK